MCKGNVLSLNISEKKGTKKTSVETIRLIEDFGVENDAHGGGERQVSLLADESIDIMRKGQSLNSGDFGENITTKGIELYTLPKGTKLKISDTILEITQIGKTCHSGCEIAREVGECIMPKQGVFAKVIKGGVLNVNDTIEVL